MTNKKIIISWLFVLIWAGIIFYLSSRTADQSTVQSRTVIGSFWGIFGTEIEDPEIMENIDGIVRETAHAVEYAILAVFVFVAMIETLRWKNSETAKKALIKTILLTLLLSFIYAISDEIHQIPIPGRAFEMLDLMIDLIGIILGTLIMTCIYKFRLVKKRSIDL